MKQVHAVLAAHLPHRHAGHRVQAETLFHQRGVLHLRDFFCRYVHDLLQPVGVFPEAKFLQARAVIRIVVDDGKGCQAVEIFHQQAFLVHVRKTERALDLLAASLPPENDYGVDEGADDFGVVDEIDPAEADNLLFPARIGLVVDDGRNAADDFAIAYGQVAGALAELQGGVLVAQRIEFVRMKGGDPVRIVFVEFFRKCDEPTQVASGTDSPDSQHLV